MDKEKRQRQERKCARCGVTRTDDVDSDICGSCADDLREQEEAENESKEAMH